jgi:sodium/potassium-transporting ATPase subunit alpha
MQDAVSGTEAIRQWRYHYDGVESLCKELKTNQTTGLTEEEADKRHQELGPNALSKKDSIPWYCLFLHELTGFFSLLLWFGSFLCFIGFGIQEDKEDQSNLYLGIVLAFVVFVTGVFSYAQASKSAEMMAQFENFIPPVATVIREGKQKNIEAKKIVPGDVVVVGGGQSIPCDIVVFKANEMKVNNASLTGESEDILIDPDLAPLSNIFESKNVGFFGTSCTAGSGTGICFKIGDSTVIGQIANLADTAEAKQTPLSIEIDRFIKIISSVAIILGVTFFIFGIIYGYDIITNLVFAIGIIVANVPEGLLATVTVSLALTAKRMAQKMVLVKNLESVETLGSTSCICSDKTGTLTQNRMTVSHMYFNRKRIDASINYQQYEQEVAKGGKIDEKYVPEYSLTDKNFMALVQAVVLGTYTIFAYEPSDDDAKMLYARVKKVAASSLEGKELSVQDNKEMKARLKYAESQMPYIHRHCKGDASETGLVQFAQAIMDLDKTRAAFPTYMYKNDQGKDTECLIPFSSDIKFNLFIRDMGKNDDTFGGLNNNLCVFMKGAPERILKRCSKILIDDKEVDFTEELRKEVDDANSFFGSQGERVLAFARLSLDAEKYQKGGYNFDVKTWKSWGLDPSLNSSQYANTPGSFPMHNLTLVGIVSLNDPPRPRVDLSVQKCRSAGIKVIMVTGDQPPTAAAIAHKVNIIKHPNKEFHTLIKQGKDREEAWQEATAIVIHGDELAKMHQAQAHLDDEDEKKGDYLREWISKPEVVFARTTPS